MFIYLIIYYGVTMTLLVRECTEMTHFCENEKNAFPRGFPKGLDRTLRDIRVTIPSFISDTLAIVETEPYSCHSELRFSPADYPIFNLFTIGFGN